MTDESTTTAHEFFDRYASALLRRDEEAIASMYAIPSLILSPRQAIAVSDVQQTREFFAGSWGQYRGVEAIEKQIVIMGEGPGTVWVDVTWSYGSKGEERFCYQLVERPHGHQIAVLTPLA